MGQPCLKIIFQEPNTDFANICICTKPLGPLWARSPFKELEHKARQNLSTINFTATFTKTASPCNTVMEKCQHSIKATFKRVKNQIQKGADPERAARRGYVNARDYFEIMNKRILIQQRALACLSKSVAHILQSELYTMGNTGLLRREAEMTLLQPHLGDSRRQELRNSPFWPTPLFRSQLVKDGEDFLLKKGTPKDSQGIGPYQNKPFHEPTPIRKEAPTIGNTGLLRREAEMTLLQPHLGDSRCQELRNLTFWPSLFKSQLVKDGEDFLLKKGTPKALRVLYPIKSSRFVVPTTTRKEAPTGNAPMGAIPLKAVTNRFPQVGRNRISEAPGVVFDPTQGDKGVETPPPNDSFQASLSPPVGGRLHSLRRDWLKNKCSDTVLNIITKGYVLPFISKPVTIPLIQSGYTALQNELALTPCIQSLLSKNAIERVENVKSLGFYSRLFLVPKPHQRWRPVIDLSSLNTFLLVEMFKMENQSPSGNL